MQMHNSYKKYWDSIFEMLQIKKKYHNDLMALKATEWNCEISILNFYNKLDYA